MRFKKNVIQKMQFKKSAYLESWLAHFCRDSVFCLGQRFRFEEEREKERAFQVSAKEANICAKETCVSAVPSACTLLGATFQKQTKEPSVCAKETYVSAVLFTCTLFGATFQKSSKEPNVCAKETYVSAVLFTCALFRATFQIISLEFWVKVWFCEGIG